MYRQNQCKLLAKTEQLLVQNTFLQASTHMKCYLLSIEQYFQALYMSLLKDCLCTRRHRRHHHHLTSKPTLRWNRYNPKTLRGKVR